MGQVTVHVTLSNARELVMARLGHLAPETVYTCEVEARVDTGTLRSVVPPADCCSSTDSSSGFSAAPAGSSLTAHSGFPAEAPRPAHSRRGASRVGVASNTAPYLAPPRGERQVETAQGRALGVSGQQIESFLCRWIGLSIFEVKNP